jgi:hypothetical protein
MGARKSLVRTMAWAGSAKREAAVVRQACMQSIRHYSVEFTGIGFLCNDHQNNDLRAVEQEAPKEKLRRGGHWSDYFTVASVRFGSTVGFLPRSLLLFWPVTHATQPHSSCKGHKALRLHWHRHTAAFMEQIRENYLYGQMKLSYCLYGPVNFEILYTALSSNFNDPYDTTVSFGP